MAADFIFIFLYKTKKLPLLRRLLLSSTAQFR